MHHQKNIVTLFIFFYKKSKLLIQFSNCLSSNGRDKEYITLFFEPFFEKVNYTYFHFKTKKTEIKNANFIVLSKPGSRSTLKYYKGYSRIKTYEDPNQNFPRTECLGAKRRRVKDEARLRLRWRLLRPGRLSQPVEAVWWRRLQLATLSSSILLHVVHGQTLKGTVF